MVHHDPSPESSHHPPFLVLLGGYATLLLVYGVLLLGVVSLSFILRLLFNSRRCRSGHLFAFNASWPIRILLVISSFLWALCELLRLPLLRSPGWLFSGLSWARQSDLCRLHVVTSLGLAEPLFFMAAMSLLRVSLQTRPNERWAVAASVFSCLPAIALHSLVTFGVPRFMSGSSSLPGYFFDAAMETTRPNQLGGVWCSFPLLSTTVTALSGTAYVPYFLVLSWRMMNTVINRTLGLRVQALASTVMIASSVHVASMGIAVFFNASDVAFQAVALLSFVSVCGCVVAAQLVLVVLPVTDSLAIVDLLITSSDERHSMKPLGTCSVQMGNP